MFIRSNPDLHTFFSACRELDQNRCNWSEGKSESLQGTETLLQITVLTNAW